MLLNVIAHYNIPVPLEVDSLHTDIISHSFGHCHSTLTIYLIPTQIQVCDVCVLS